MRTGAGLRNAFLFLLLVVGLHMVIVRLGAAPPAPKAAVAYGGDATARRRAAVAAAAAAGPVPPSSTMLSELRRRRTQEQPSSAYMEAWPPGPDDLAGSIPIGAFQPAHQTPYTREDEERAALHRLVFSTPDPADMLEVARAPTRVMTPDYSGLHMAAEASVTSALPMHYIRPCAREEAGDGDVSGMLSWGAGYQPLLA